MPQDESPDTKVPDEPGPEETVTQRIPFEADEDGTFIPPCFIKLRDEGKFPNPPSFELRWCTPRNKRWRGLLMEEMGAVSHSTAELREELLRGLEIQWGMESLEEQRPILDAYWHAADEFEVQKRDDPDLTFDYNPVIQEAMRQLELDITQAHRPFGKMLARNSYAAQMSFTAMQAVVIRGFTGLGIEPKFDRGYLDLDCVDEVLAALQRLDVAHNLARGISASQLFVACVDRFRLRETEAGNSASPSPSGKPPQNSKTGAGETAGKSRVSDTSKKIPASA